MKARPSIAEAAATHTWPDATRHRAREQWATARRAVPCGRCETPIAAGNPLLEIVGQTWRVVRCASCAKEPVPSVIHTMQPSPSVDIRARFVAMLDRVQGRPSDFKHAQGNDR